MRAAIARVACWRACRRRCRIPAAQWDALHDGRNPFVAHAFLSGLEQHGCLRARLGLDAAAPDAVGRRRRWSPRRPATCKANSHGEFVFDHAWAHAYAQHGLDYFPKWLCAVPYSPVTGPRLLARDDGAPARAGRRRSARAVRARRAGRRRTSISMPSGRATRVRRRLAAAHRRAVPLAQRPRAGRTSTTSSLPSTTSTARTSARSAPRSRARGVTLPRRARRRGQRRRPGDDARLLPADLRRIRQHARADAGVPPAPGARRCRAHWCCSWPSAKAQPIAGALCLRGGDTLYGRYWGADRTDARPAFRDLLLPGHRLLPARRPDAFRARRAGRAQARARLPADARAQPPLDRATPDFARRIARLVRAGSGFGAALRRDARLAFAVQVARADDRHAHADVMRDVAMRPPASLPTDPDAPFPPARHGIARARRPAGRGRRPVAAAAAQCLSARHLSLVFARAQPILWWSPDPRMVFRTDGVRLSSRFRRWLRAVDWTVRADTAFDAGDRQPARASRAPASAAPGSPRRCWPPTATLHRLGPRALRRGVRRASAWSAASTASRSAGCSSARACSAPNPAARRWRWPPSPTACTEWGWPLIDAQVENDAPAAAWAPNRWPRDALPGAGRRA